ncbi:hypothetical protein JB92DRAFT_327563 [Gautieria morchelliformis]|nr:hypothetical protein JB92DRAFT_327563 [Gautieria morchelliformis]
MQTDGHMRETRKKKSSAWQDLVKVVNLKTCIVDTRESLEGIVRNCDRLMEEDGYNESLRECSEREEWVRTLRAERYQVIQHSAKVKDAIESKRKALELRRNTLSAARIMHQKHTLGLASQAEEVISERQRHSTLVSSLLPIRTALIQTISFIFPIEPLSPADLLFTILGAPLPIPALSSDPAPPLTLASHPDITEDTTATALGYVAQLVHLVSAYLGKGLVYPVTCCGSRSVIKDPISAMMGPRMFA